MDFFSPVFVDTVDVAEILAGAAAALCGVCRSRRDAAAALVKLRQRGYTVTSAFNTSGKCPLSFEQNGRAAAARPKRFGLLPIRRTVLYKLGV